MSETLYFTATVENNKFTLELTTIDENSSSGTWGDVFYFADDKIHLIVHDEKLKAPKSVIYAAVGVLMVQHWNGVYHPLIVNIQQKG